MKTLLAALLFLPATLTLNAQTRTWLEVHDYTIRVLFQAGDRKNAEELIKVVTKALPDLEKKIGATFNTPAFLYLAASQEEFERLTGHRLPAWSQGVSFPETNSIILKSPQFSHDIATCHVTALHEVVHLLIARRVPANIPRWFNEGLALSLSGEGAGKPLVPLSRALWAGKLIALEDIENVDAFNHKEAELAYIESYHATDYLVRQFGWGGIARLLEDLSQGVYWNDALFKLSEMDQAGFEAAWLIDLKRSYRWMILLDLQIYLFLGMTFLVLIAGILVMRRRRKIYKRWESEEALNEGNF